MQKTHDGCTRLPNGDTVVMRAVLAWLYGFCLDDALEFAKMTTSLSSHVEFIVSADKYGF
jgi:predicted anti-sigma-YlaC factor YlaD